MKFADMKKRASRLQRIVVLAQAEERQFGAQMRTSRARLTEQIDRLGEFNVYRREVHVAAPKAAHLRSADLNNRQDFVHRLDRAIRAQHGIVEDCQKSLELHRRKWQEKRRRVESLRRVQNRILKEELARAERIEQRSLDDRPATPGIYEDQQ